MNSVDHKLSGRFSTRTEHGEAELLYKIEGKTMVIYHTFTPKDDRGNGVAAQLAEQAFKMAKDQSLKVRPDCPYITYFIEKHKEFERYIV